jgi:hypothetical protein
MKDLVCLVADRNMRATVAALLARPEALGISPIDFEVLVHPRRDAGCFHEPAGLLQGYRRRCRHAVVVLDQEWDGAPPGGAEETERLLEGTLRASGLEGWARAVVIEPELEVWMFVDSPHVATVLGWRDRQPDLRTALAEHGWWRQEEVKPLDPKASVEWALRQVRIPRSSSIYRDIAGRVSLSRCRDRSFERFRDLLRGWFGARPSASRRR